MKPTISVVIRCKDEGKYIGEVLTRVFEQVSRVPFEVVVLDSGSETEPWKSHENLIPGFLKFSRKDSITAMP